MGWAKLKGMWKNTAIPREKAFYLNRGEGAFEDATLKIKVSGDDGSESVDELTDDDVFKELINIVVDVISSKSEKCSLTFEMPGQSGDMVGWKRCNPRWFRSDVAVDGQESRSDVIALHKYKRVVDSDRRLSPTSVKSRQIRRKWDPLMQTVLSAKRGFADLEDVLRFRRSRSRPNLWKGLSDARGGSRGHKSGIERSCLGENPLVYCGGNSSLHVELQDVSDALGDLSHIVQDEDFFGCRNSIIFSREISNHFAEIKSHIVSIKNHLQHESAVNSQWDASDAEFGPKGGQDTVSSCRGKKRQRFKLIRVGTGDHKSLGRQSSKVMHGRKNGRPSKNEEDHRSEKDLGDVLVQYEKVKKKETKLVKELLDRISLSKGSKDGSAKSQMKRCKAAKAASSVKSGSVGAIPEKTREKCRLKTGKFTVVGSSKTKKCDPIRKKNETLKELRKKSSGNCLNTTLHSQWPGGWRDDIHGEELAPKVDFTQIKSEENQEKFREKSPVERQRDQHRASDSNETSAQRGSPELRESCASLSSKDDSRNMMNYFKKPVPKERYKNSSASHDKKDLLMEEMKERLRKYKDKRLKNEALKTGEGDEGANNQEPSDSHSESECSIQTLIENNREKAPREGSPDFKSILQRFNQFQQPSDGPTSKGEAQSGAQAKIGAFKTHKVVGNFVESRDQEPVLTKKVLKPNESPVRGLSSHQIQVRQTDQGSPQIGNSVGEQPPPIGSTGTTENSEVETKKVKNKKKTPKRNKCTIS